MTAALPLELIGAPFDLAASRRGCRLGPDALRAVDLLGRLRGLGHQIVDGGNVYIPPPGATTPNPKLKNLDAVLACCEGLAERVEHALRTGKRPLIVGGDHSIAMGSIGGAARVAKRLGLIWVDAHADYNDSVSSPSGNVHGMPLAAALGQADAILNDIAAVNPKVRAEDTVLIGVRDVDPGETIRLRASGITVFTSWDVETRGIVAIAEEARDIATANTDALHLSFDLDVLDPLEMPGTGTTSPGGMSYREACVFVQTLEASGRVTSLEFTELNPLLDDAGRSCRLARDLITYALGRQLY